MTEDDEAVDVRDEDLDLIRELAQGIATQAEGEVDGDWIAGAARLIESLADVPGDGDRDAARAQLTQLPHSS